MNSSIADSLAITVGKRGGIEFPAEILEFSIDQFLDEGILKDIPFVGWIAKGLSIGMTISDRILYHKILRFLYALNVIQSEATNKFSERIESDSDYRRKVGEHLLLVLDKMDAFDKANLLAIVFDHLLTRDIEHAQFIDLAHVLDRSSLADLKALDVPDSQRIKFNSAGLAAASGILEYGISEPSPGQDLPELGTRLSSFGRDLRDMFRGRFRTRAKDERTQRKKFQELFFQDEIPSTN